MTVDRDEKGRLLPGSRLGQGRPKLEVEERLRSAIYAVCDQDTMTKWIASMQKKIAHGDQWASTFIFERSLGKVADKLEHTGPVRIIVEYLDQTTHSANQDSAE